MTREIHNQILSKITWWMNILLRGESCAKRVIFDLQPQYVHSLASKNKCTICVVSDLRLSNILAYIHLKIYHGVNLVLPTTCLIPDYGDDTPYLLRKAAYLILYPLCTHVNINTSEQQKQLHVKTVGFYSSLTSIAALSNPNDINQDSRLSKNVACLDLAAQTLIKYIEDMNPSALIIFNGRVASVLAIALFAQYNAISLYFLEFGRGNNGYRLYTRSPHLPGCNALGALDLMNHGFLRKIEKEIHKIYPQIAASAREKEDNIYSRISSHSPKMGKVISFDSVIFLGSDHEYNYIDPSLTGVYVNQNRNLVLYAFSCLPNSSHCLRFHPNSLHDKTSVDEISSYAQTLADYYNVKLITDASCTYNTSELIHIGKRLFVAHSSVAFDILLAGKKPCFASSQSDCQVFLENFELFSLGGVLNIRDAVGLYFLLLEYIYLIPFPWQFRLLHIIVNPLFLTARKLRSVDDSIVSGA